ncbi:methionine--tRNA ligase [Candidatus Jorgensenbacteria bacterium GWA1_54_12]|uniref:Methionine--tRNA ligase n=1 Tax=Candidatus Jorgensenbacteria bacterium GWA1_54_12 TaxID=1798468 RepID=A0A1F6BL65_9BACT|nr:MAG: methionine--tRNA ligase [Candidatus Jorgensenbacteria bacterium GWA1_54_12]
MQKIFVGVAWPYVNGHLHVGHLAGYLLPADIFARFCRLRGADILMVSGSDCFGTPITTEADKRGITPQEVVNEYYPEHVKLFEEAGIRFDIFTKTMTENHIRLAQDFFLAFLKNGYLFKKRTKQYYDPSAQRFLPDRYVEGTCPSCGAERARGDQCDECGRVFEAGELVNPVSALSGAPVELKESEHYFFDLKKLQPFIERYVEGRGENWKEWVRNETDAWLARGLVARAFSRDLEWGVPFPIDKIPKAERIEGIEHKRFYVWWEALMGYYTASRERDDWKEWWYNRDAEHYYFMGKDNLPFHTMFWPAELHAYDEELHLPDVISVNQFLTLDGKQFSKSRGVTVDSRELIARYGADAVRFYLTYIMPEYADTSFSWGDFAERVNSVLIGNLGNFLNRALTLAKDQTFNARDVGADVSAAVAEKCRAAREALEKPEFRTYLDAVLMLSDFGNKYVAREEPWKRDGNKRDAAVTNACYIALALQLLIQPLLPHASERLAEMTGVRFNSWDDDVSRQVLDALERMKARNPEPLFQKIEIE